MAALLLVAGCGGSPPAADPDAEGPDPFAATSGGRLPDVRLAALTGDGSVDLGELRGPAVVNVWASWCGPCREELPLYEGFAQAHGGVVDVVGITSEDTSDEAARDLVAETGVTYPNFIDPGGELRAIALPQVLLVDGEGEIAFSQYLEIESVEDVERLVTRHLGVEL